MGLCQSEPETKKTPAKNVPTSSSASSNYVPLRSPTQEERLAAKCTKIEHDDFLLGPDQKPFRYSACLYPGFAQTQRKNCQDSFMSLTLSISSGKKNQPDTLYRCLGIFDGHGATGHEVSHYLVEQLPLILERMLASKKYSVIQRMLSEAFLEVNKKLNKESGIEVGMSGSTGTLVLLSSDTIYAANIGDSRAVLGYASAMEMREKSVHDSELDSENGEFEEEEELIDEAKLSNADPAPTSAIELVNATNPSAVNSSTPSSTDDGPTGANGAGMSYIAEFDEQGGPLSRLESEVLPMNFAQIAKLKAAAGNKGTPLGIISTNTAVQNVSSLHSGSSPSPNDPARPTRPIATDSPSSAPMLRANSDSSAASPHHDRSISDDAAIGIMPLPDTPLVHAASITNTPDFAPLVSLNGPPSVDASLSASVVSSSAPSTTSADSALQSAVTLRSASVTSEPPSSAAGKKKKKKKKAKNASQEFADYYKSQFPRCSVKEITVNHNFKDVEEKRRIEGKGGIVQQYRNMLGQPVGPFRVYDQSTTGPGLAVSRSFGDAAAHKLGVIAEPSVIAVEIKPEHQFLVIASDGVWDQMSNQEVVTRVYEAHGNDSVAEEIVMKCAERWISANFGLTDDISIIIVYFPTGRTLRAARRHQSIVAARAAAK